MMDDIEGIPDESRGDAYSNFDHILEVTEREIKKSGKYYYHNAWNFNAVIWWDKKRKSFVEIVSQYHFPVARYEYRHLKSVIKRANEGHGYD